MTSEIKRRRARLLLGWGTAWEDLGVLSAVADWPMANCMQNREGLMVHKDIQNRDGYGCDVADGEEGEEEEEGE